MKRIYALLFTSIFILIQLTGCNTASSSTPNLTIVCKTAIRINPSSIGDLSHGYVSVHTIIDDGPERATFIDVNGNMLDDHLYESAYGFDRAGKALVQLENNTWAYINTNGQIIRYADAPKSEADYSMFYQEGDKFGLLSENSTPLTDAIFTFITPYIYDDYAFVEYENLSTALIDRQGNAIVQLPKGCKNPNLKNDRIFCRIEDESGVRQTMLDATGKELLTEQYDLLRNCNDQWLAVVKDGKLGLLDMNGRELVRPSIPCDSSIDVRIGYGENHLSIPQNGYLTFVKICE